ncbi:MAG: adenylosuccinate lyase [Candidatus Aminicenantales bacterium]
MIERYTRPQMGKIWTEKNKFQKWLDVELAVCEAWKELGKIPHRSLENIKKKAGFSLKRISQVEKVIKHDVIAFLTSIAEHVGEDSRYIHLGLTSYDVVDTALSLLVKQSLYQIKKDLISLKEALREQALRHKKTVIMGRTHGVHAEPITFGVKLLVWFEEVKRHLFRLERAIEVISVGRISGSVGTYIHLDPRVETIALKKLGLKPANVSTQVLQRDRHAEVLSVLALIASSLDKFATEIRHLQRTEVLEVEEPFTKGQKGSSSMPHKRNPVRAERVSGLARIIRSNLHVALESIPLWHERDISHSSCERIILPDSFIIEDFLLSEMDDIIRNWSINSQKMSKNIELTQGLIFSQSILLALTEKGISRENAYKLVQSNSFRAMEEERNLKQLILQDPEIKKHLSRGEIEKCFSLKPFLDKIDYIYERVFKDED